MIIKILESLKDEYSVGDVVFLEDHAFEREKWRGLITSNHRFVVVDDSFKDYGYYIVSPLSSKKQKVSSRFPNNVRINNYQKIKTLYKPTHTESDTFGKVFETDIKEYLGTLDNSDLRKLLRIYKTSPQRQKLESYFKHR